MKSVKSIIDVEGFIVVSPSDPIVKELLSNPKLKISERQLEFLLSLKEGDIITSDGPENNLWNLATVRFSTFVYLKKEIGIIGDIKGDYRMHQEHYLRLLRPGYFLTAKKIENLI